MELLNASTDGNLILVQSLVNQGNYTDYTLNQSLILGSGYGYLNIVRFLLDSGANPHTDNDRALLFAVLNDRLSVIREFLIRGYDFPSWIPDIRQRYQHLIPKEISAEKYYQLELITDDVQDSFIIINNQWFHT
jgi:ankyrin repeat protein